ncbi:MAG TPA: alpha/beta hydrolase [Kofleriaceae bacterium]|nr:alpha/beta hydrolase [Kofleriaceae bacterium]
MQPELVSANGLRFAYLAAGAGPLVLLVHGFPDTAHTWDRTLPAIAAAGFRAVAPFTRGYHPTQIPADGAYDLDTLGRDLIALIEALGEERAVIVGHDWGAAAGYAAAALRPERVRLLVTLAIPHPGGMPRTPALAWSLRHFVSLRRKHAAARVRANDFAYVDELVRRWSPAWSVPRAETAQVKKVFREPGCLDAALAYYRAVGLRLPASQRKQIMVPTVAFAGEHDMIAPRVYEKARHKFEASYEVVQVPGGHFMHREHPDHFIPELVRVLREA